MAWEQDLEGSPCILSHKLFDIWDLIVFANVQILIKGCRDRESVEIWDSPSPLHVHGLSKARVDLFPLLSRIQVQDELEVF